ncbi:Uu.00g026100.m01.CDS01 [Anthostomella pinea]|uniref:Uu.00g026100.m01.CDS01 n=1 Tax=Anthostomella pinea TaxID=933095 RepID=A0AAI8YCK5_9PEZI|nr:Uu.00g026100.m01.CDS01 [Anthostomella pinea]
MGLGPPADPESTPPRKSKTTDTFELSESSADLETPTWPPALCRENGADRLHTAARQWIKRKKRNGQGLRPAPKLKHIQRLE